MVFRKLRCIKCGICLYHTILSCVIGVGNMFRSLPSLSLYTYIRWVCVVELKIIFFYIFLYFVQFLIENFQLCGEAWVWKHLKTYCVRIKYFGNGWIWLKVWSFVITQKKDFIYLDDKDYDSLLYVIELLWFLWLKGIPHLFKKCYLTSY